MKLLALFSLLIMPLLADFVNSTDGGLCNTGTNTCTMTLGVTSGNFVLVHFTSSGQFSLPMTCSDGVNTYAAVAGSPWNLSGTGSVENTVAIFSFTVATTTTLTITCTRAATVQFLQSSAVQYAGTAIAIDKVAALSVAFAVNPNGTSWNTGTTTFTSTASELLVAFFGNTDPNTPANTNVIQPDFTQRENTQNGSINSTAMTLVGDKFVNSRNAYFANMMQSGTASGGQFGTNVIVTLTGVSGNPVPSANGFPTVH